MAATQSYNVTAKNREDLFDIITHVTPDDTPIISSLSTISVNAIQHEWVTRALNSTAYNAAVEGAEFTDDEISHDEVEEFLKSLDVGEES